MDVTVDFLRFFLQGLYFTAPLLLIFFFIILLIGQIVGRYEEWSKFDAFYWSFITAITVGYGDFHPRKKLSKGLAVLTAFVGIVFTGLIVAVALHAVQTAFQKHI